MKERNPVYKVHQRWSSFYSGPPGEVFWSDDARHVFGQYGPDIRKFSVESKTVVGTIENEEDPVIRFAKTSEWIYTCHKSGLVRVWDEDLALSKTFNGYHKTPVIGVAVREPYLVTASSDGILKLWDTVNQACIGVFKDYPTLPTVVKLSETEAAVVLSGYLDGTVVMWDVKSSTSKILKKHQSHVSDVLEFGGVLLTASRDKTLCQWNKKEGEWLPTKMIPTMEVVECLCPYTEESVISGDAKGQIKEWTVPSLVQKPPPKFAKSLLTNKEITRLKKMSDTIAIVQQNIIFQVDSKSEEVQEKYMSNFDDILDLTVVAKDTLAVASNTSLITAHNLKTNQTSFLEGHTDSVLALTACRDGSPRFASSGKDMLVIVWELQDGEYVQIASVSGHASPVGSVALKGDGLWSASKDGIIKSWNIYGVGEVISGKTVIGHKQDVNSIDVSPSGQMLASASQDKQAKVWSTNGLGLMATLNGHKRGIWKVRFSVFDQRVLLTASADATIKLWELDTFSCYRTFDGHLSSVLNCEFLTQRTIVSSSSDFVVKVWDVQSEVCLGSYDDHEDKIWALAVGEDFVVSGGEDSTIMFWKDVSEEIEKEKMEIDAKTVEEDQTLRNLVNQGKHEKVLPIALRMKRGQLAMKTLEQLRRADRLTDVVSKLKKKERYQLLQFIRTWNSYGPRSEIAQVTLNALLKSDPTLLESESILADQGLLGFTKKHWDRVEKLRNKTAIVNALIERVSI